MQPDADLEAHLCRAYDTGRAAWPSLELPAERFAAHLAAHSAGGAPAEDLHAADFYLATACVARVRSALEAFERAYMPRVPGYLARIRPSPDLLEEVRQTIREKLFVGRDGAAPKIAEYSGKGALASWLRVVTLRVAVDLGRKRREATGDRSSQAESPATRDAEMRYIQDRYRPTFDGAVRTALSRISADQRALLRLHFVDGVTLDELARRFAVHRATVARRLAAAREAVAAEAHSELRSRLGASDSEVESLVRLLRDYVDVSLVGLLGDAPLSSPR